MFLGSRSIGLLLQKHANRTVHPSKIEGVRSLLSVLLHAAQGGPLWDLKSAFLGFQLGPDFLVFQPLVQTLHFESFRCLQEVKFVTLLVCSWMYPDAQIRFFLVLGKPVLFLGPRVVPWHEFGTHLEEFFAVLDRFLGFFERATLCMLQHESFPP